tara:strand:+ start:4865 stop:5251 length:387 start_codon:yes stop_codon:yes gene_type:complete
MAIPTGSGTEVLWRGSVSQQQATGTAARFDTSMPSVGTSSYTVPTNFIVTVMTVTFCNVSTGDAELINMYIENGAGQINILYKQPLAASKTFIFNDKLVLHPTEKLVFHTDGAANVDIYYSYILQNWT